MFLPKINVSIQSKSLTMTNENFISFRIYYEMENEYSRGLILGDS